MAAMVWNGTRSWLRGAMGVLPDQFFCGHLWIEFNPGGMTLAPLSQDKTKKLKEDSC
jgi:hypothetical protein